MKAAATGCAIILAATAVMIGLWWLLATYVFSTTDDGPSVGQSIIRRAL